MDELIRINYDSERPSTVAFLHDYTTRKREEDVRYERGNDADRAL